MAAKPFTTVAPFTRRSDAAPMNAAIDAGTPLSCGRGRGGSRLLMFKSALGSAALDGSQSVQLHQVGRLSSILQSSQWLEPEWQRGIYAIGLDECRNATRHGLLVWTHSVDEGNRANRAPRIEKTRALSGSATASKRRLRGRARLSWAVRAHRSWSQTTDNWTVSTALLTVTPADVLLPSSHGGNMRQSVRLVIVLLCGIASSGCVNQTVKDAVNAYGIAVSQVAEAGKANLAQCLEVQDVVQRKPFCEKAKQQFEVILTSADQLQKSTK
jgi:hypothetical protein